MREIKFRGKDHTTGKWVYGSYVRYKDYSGKIIEAIIDENGYIIKIIPETVRQFTGLLGFNIGEFSHQNKAEQEAYYGDIIKFIDTEGDVFTKELWWNEELQCTMVGSLPYYYLHESGFIQPSKLVFQIIGNIHDNPELLKRE